VDLNNAA
jgi:hypothetical protein